MNPYKTHLKLQTIKNFFCVIHRTIKKGTAHKQFPLNFRIKTKKPQPFGRDCYFSLSTLIKRWFQSCDLHTLLNEQFRLQFPFVFRRLQSLQMLLPVHPCLPLALLTFSGPSIPRLTPLPFRFLTSAVLAFFRPPQFWILTTQPLFCLSFPSRCRLTVAFPVPALALASSVSSFSPA